MKPKFAVNLATLKVGGGQNVGLNFLMALRTLPKSDLPTIAIVAKGTRCADFLEANRFCELLFVSQNPILRIVQERCHIARRLRRAGVSIVYTCFGYASLGEKVFQVGGSADSNLYYPEVDFWVGYNTIRRLTRRLIDLYRLYALRRLDAVVFENQDLMKRGVERLGLRRVQFIPPSFSPPDNCEDLVIPEVATQARTGRVLMLCGWQRNKNVMLLPALAKQAISVGLDLHFLLTASPDDGPEHIEFENYSKRLQVREKIHLLGQVKKEQLASLFAKVNVCLLLSKLESFSNNILEAWTFGVPLVVADEPWARSICGNAAVYVERSDEIGIVAAISRIVRDGEYRFMLVDQGRAKLSSYPTATERAQLEVSYVQEVYQALSRSKL